MNPEYKPYVVSEDTGKLMNEWAYKNALSIPSSSYLDGMTKDLREVLERYFSSVDIVPERFMTDGLNTFIQNSKTPIVSLDRAYVRDDQSNLVGFLDATRVVDSQLKSVGLASRNNMPIELQINKLLRKQRTIAPLDDVIFEGDTMINLIQQLRQRGAIIDTVYAGIAIRGGVKRLEDVGVRTKSLIFYDSVTDEICERDFRVGAPFSGRTIVNLQAIQGVPYVYPFGKPIEWASIPKNSANEFSLFCLYQSLEFWKRTEQLSQRSVPPKQLEKQVFGLPDMLSVSDALQEVILNFKGDTL